MQFRYANIYSSELECYVAPYVLIIIGFFLESHNVIKLGSVRNLLNDMASGEENFLQKSLLAPYVIIAKKLTAMASFP